jgi:class 3 adenylate cyclase
VRRFLGEGSRKRVYLAYDSRLDREVAIALIKTAGLDEGVRARVHREAQAMGRLGDHPHIVTVHDIGEEDDRLYIVSQYMSGGDLAGLLAEAGDEHLPIERALAIAQQVCRALEHAHTRGIIHRDLKPGNVWLSEDGTAMLGDFGLALALDQSRLTQEGTMVGTPAYLPPEQALGRTPDARSDLYALGATLYELLTGRPPFLGDDAVSIISQHINTPPVAPSWHNEAISQPLENLVLRLLEKDPSKRPADAAQVRANLETVGRAPTLPRDTAERAEANPLDRLAGGVFVGRDREVQALRSGLDDALSGRGRILMLVGEPGIGKTRTAEELATYAQMRGGQVLWGRCYEGEGAPAYWPWVQILRSYVHDRDPKELLSDMGPGAADIAGVVSEVRERLPGLPEPPELDPEEARFRLFDSITTFLRNASKRTPLVLMLDDLHWADKPSLLLLQFLARELGPLRLLVLGSYRDVELGRQHPLEETLAELTRTQLCERILLRGLQAVDVARFIELTAGREPPAALVEAVYRETEGNPFFVSEVVRLLQSDGRLEDLESVASWSVEIPQGVRQVIGRRLSALSEEANRILTIASVIGREFELLVLSQAADSAAGEVLERIEEAEDARIVVEMEGAAGRYRFSHALIRETLYDELRTTHRLRLHRRVADVLESLAGSDESRLAELSHHFCEAATGGDVEKAVDYAVRAAERAEAMLAYEEAAIHYDRALGALEVRESPNDERQCDLLLALGRAHTAEGAGKQAREVFRRGLTIARSLGDAERFANIVLPMMLTDLTGSTEVDEEGVTALQESLRRLPEGDSSLRSRTLARLAGANFFIADRNERLTMTAEALDMARRLGDKQAIILALSSRFLAGGGDLQDDLETDLALTDEMIRVARELGDMRSEDIGHRNRLIALTVYLCEPDAVDRELAIMRELATQIRQPLYLSEASFAAASVALWRGQLAEARTLSFEAFQQRRRIEPTGAAQLHGLQVVVMRWMQGRLAESVGLIEAGRRQFDAIVWRPLLAHALLAAGREEEARAEYEELATDDFAVVVNGPTNWPDLILLSEVCWSLGDVARAGALYEHILPLRGTSQGFIRLALYATVSCTLGQLASVLCRFDEATQHFEEAIESERRTHAWGWLPRTQCAYARMLLDRGQHGDGERALELLSEALEISQERGLKGWVDRAVALKLRAQGVDSGSFPATASIDVVATSAGRRRPDLSPHTAPDGTVTLLLSDMENFTAMTERLGDLKAHEVVREHNRMIREELAIQEGYEVDTAGDGFLLAFKSARQGLACAIAIQRALAARNAGADEPISVRIGLHTGEALKDADKFFGKTVILAARIGGAAKGGQILVSSLLKQLTESAGDIRFGETREIELKGISAPQSVVEVEWS